MGKQETAATSKATAVQETAVAPEIDREGQLSAEISALESERREVGAMAESERAAVDEAVQQAKVSAELGESSAITPAEITERRKVLGSMEARIREIDQDLDTKRAALKILRNRAQASERERVTAKAYDLVEKGLQDMEELQKLMGSVMEIYDRIDAAASEIHGLRRKLPDPEIMDNLRDCIMIRDMDLGWSANPYWVPNLRQTAKEWAEKMQTKVEFSRRRMNRGE